MPSFRHFKDFGNKNICVHKLCPLQLLNNQWLLQTIFTAWFPKYFDYDYYHVAFVFLPSLVITDVATFTPGILTFLLLVAIPYALMVRIQLKSPSPVMTRLHYMNSPDRIIHTQLRWLSALGISPGFN